MPAAKGSARTPLGPIVAYGCQTPSAQRRSDQLSNRDGRVFKVNHIYREMGLGQAEQHCALSVHL